MARSLLWKDIAALPRYRNQKLLLDNALRLVYNPGILSSSLISLVAPNSGYCTGIEPIGGQNYPFLIGQICCQSEMQTARITFLAPDDEKEYPAYNQLLAHLCGQAANHGALQVLAEVGSNTAAEAILFKAGFRPYAEQQIWRLRPITTPGTGRSIWEPISRQDYHQAVSAYQNFVPSQIQRVETIPSLSKIQGLIGKHEDKVAGLATMIFGPRGILLDIILDPNLNDLDGFVKELMQCLPYKNSRDIYVRVRGYQQRLASILEIIGAESGQEQKAMVKRLAVHYNAKQAFLVQGFEKQPDITTPISNSKIK